MSTDDFGRRLRELIEDNSESVRFVRFAEDARDVDMNRVIAADTKVFGNGDHALLIFASRSLAEGKDVVIIAAGPRMLRIATGHELIPKRGRRAARNPQ